MSRLRLVLAAGAVLTVGASLGLRPTTPSPAAARPSASRAPGATVTAAMPAARGGRPAPVTAPRRPVGALAALPDVARRTEAAALLRAAGDARAQGDLRATLDLLQTAVAYAPAVETHAALGGLYLELGVVSAADTHLRAAAEGDPRTADRWIGLANALALKPDPFAAAAALERARATEPGLRVTRDTGGWLRREPTVSAPGLLRTAVSAAPAQCAPGGNCTEYLGTGRKGSYFRILVPNDWDGDIFLVNHGLELDPLTIAPHNTCKGDPTTACAVDADCAGIGPGACHEISTLGFEEILLPKGKAVGASTFSQTSWSAFRSRFDLKAMIKFLRKKGPGRPKRIIVTGFSGGGAVTVDATMRLAPGRMIHGAIPLCSASAGGTPTVDSATDVRLVYDHLCNDVPGGSLASLPDVGDPTLSQIEFGLIMNTCLGWLVPSSDPVEAAAQQARLDTMYALTKIPGPNFNLVHVMGFSVLAMGDFVLDPERLNGRRPGWNEGLDYTTVYAGPAGETFNDEVPRFGPGRGRRKMARNPRIDFTRRPAKRVRYPILSFAGRADHICMPEFQKVYADAATYGGKDHALIWGSTGGHCVFTPFELRAVVEEYLAWLDTYRPGEDTPTTADVLARCLSLPGASPSQCNFDTAFTPPPLVDRVPPRADWVDAARNPLP